MKSCLLLVLLVSTAAAGQPPLPIDFNLASTLSLAYGPFDVAGGDFNHDNQFDLVFAVNDVYVVLNQGNGVFAPATSYTAGRGTIRVSVADVNQDGNLDVVALLYADPGETSTIAVLLGDGKGGFSGPNIYPCGINARYMAIADLDSDGTPDILAGAYNVISLPVLFNDGAGRFDTLRDLDFPREVGQVTLADLNADNRTDLVANHYDEGTIDVLLGKADGAFESPLTLSVGSRPTLVAVADFNEDGSSDLAVFQSQELSVWAGDGEGGFTQIGATSTRFVYSPIKVEAADVNGDGHKDIVWISFMGATVNILFGDGHGEFSSEDYNAGSFVEGFTIGDLNGDGHLDIAAPDDISGDVFLLFNKGDGSFAAPRAYGRVYRLADFNGDGKLDSLAADLVVTNRLYARLGNGDGTFGAAYPVIFDEDLGFGHGASTEVGDLNNDGYSDLVRKLTWNGVGVFLGRADGSFVGAPDHPLLTDCVGLGDFDGDGKLDLTSCGLPRTSTTNNVRVFTNAAVSLGNGDGTFGPEQQVEGSGPYGPLAVADLNKDGKLDLVVRLNVYLGNGDGSFGLATTLPASEWLSSVKAADVDGDGNLDLIAGSSHTEGAVYRGDGQGGFTKMLDLVGAYGAQVGDFNRDGIQDLVLIFDGSAQIFLGQGGGSFTPGPQIPAAGVVADVNGDGWPDMVSIMVLLNQTSTKLGLAHTSAGAVLTWPSYTAGLMLQSTESLAAPDWQRVPGPVSVVGDRYVVTNATTRPTQFFRLRRQ